MNRADRPNRSRSCHRAIASVAGVLLLLALSAASCASAPQWQAVRWESQDGREPPQPFRIERLPGVGRAPGRPALSAFGLRATIAPRRARGNRRDGQRDRFLAENAFYADCMHQKGFRQAPAAVPSRRGRFEVAQATAEMLRRGNPVKQACIEEWYRSSA